MYVTRNHEVVTVYCVNLLDSVNLTTIVPYHLQLMLVGRGMQLSLHVVWVTSYSDIQHICI